MKKFHSIIRTKEFKKILTALKWCSNNRYILIRALEAAYWVFEKWNQG